MFRDYFGIAENPFSNTPDPNYFYLSDLHKEALAHLQYGIQGSSGFVLLTGEVGTGKTTVCRYLLDDLPENIDLALCLNPRLSEVELLATICDELRIDVSGCSPESVKDHMDALNNHLLVGYAKGRRAVLIIDEAQSLGYPLLEQIRLLTNLETASTKLLQVILIGQPELRDILDQENMRQLSQRITARYHLEPMSEPEADNYIRHRLKKGGLGTDLIDRSAFAEIFDRSGGVPRLINSICERCLLGAYAKGKTRIDGPLARTAANEVLGEKPSPPKAPQPRQRETVPARVALGVALAAALVMGTFTLSSRDKVERAMASDSQPATEAREKTPAPEPAPAAAEKPASTQAAEAVATPAEEPPAPDRQPAVAEADGPAGEDAGIPPPQPEQKAAAAPDDEALQAISRLLAEGAVTSPEPAAAETETASRQDLAAEEVTLENLFRHPGVDGAMETAVARLFGFWNKRPTAFSGLNPCAEAKALGLWCYQRRGGLKRIRAINLPALVSLDNGERGRRYAVVSAVDGAKVTLDIDGRKIAADAESLKGLWSGDFLVLWKPLPSIRINLRAGMKGKDVKWLRDRLTNIMGIPADAGNPELFDADLTKLVIAFQKDHKIKGDGIVGVMTQIQLSAAVAGTEVPALRSQP